MLLDQLFKWNAHRLFNHAGLFDMPADLEQLGASVVLTPEAAEPSGPAPQDRWNHRNALNIVHRGRTAIQASACRERRLQARLAFLALKAFDHRGLFTANVCASAPVHEHVKVIARAAGILANQTRIIGFVDGRLKRFRLANILAANVDIGRTRPHREASYQCAFDQLVWIMADNLAVFAGTRLRFVGVNNEKAWPAIGGGFGHKRPFEAGGKARPAPAAQTARLHLFDDRILPALNQSLGAIPIAARLRCLQTPVLEAIDIGKDAVLISQHHLLPLL